MVKGGFIPRAKKSLDKRFSLTRNFGAPSLNIPLAFSVEDLKGDISGPREQGENLCSAMTTSEIGADEWGIPMSGAFQAMAISLCCGRPLFNIGASVDDALKSGREYGFLPKNKEPFSWEEKGESFVCEYTNWPQELIELAKRYRIAGGDFVVDGPYDAFDNFRTQLYAHRPNNGISLGIPWFQTFNGTGPNGIVHTPDPTYGLTWHNIEMKGFDRIGGIDYIKCRSWNKADGARTYFYFSRPIFNLMLGMAGAIGKMYKSTDEQVVGQLKDTPRNLIEFMLDLYNQVLFKYRQLQYKHQ